jgi:hypothetical protein
MVAAMANNEALARRWGQQEDNADATIKSRQWQRRWQVVTVGDGV